MGIIDDRGYNQMFSPAKALSIRVERRCDLMVESMNLREGIKVLEIGCGTGELSYMLSKKTKAEILSTDICAPFITEAKSKYALPNLTFELMDFNSPESVMDRKFDYVVGNGILHHLYYQLDHALKNIFSLLNKNGKIIFWEPNLLNPYCFLIFSFPFFRKRAKLEPAEMAFTKSCISEKLLNAGFSKVKVEYRDFLLPNTPEFLIGPLIAAGSVAERIPVIKYLSQSIFITAEK